MGRGIIDEFYLIKLCQAPTMSHEFACYTLCIPCHTAE
ncbi:hypothetical protein LOKO_01478 [Halomonas chromatireducens]|uniref:Uncharacterized protein n=1 Tax=Halomonas chromatireducens TaxID=507626 RepID=A0A120JVX6_9GAMM|nr:hypothetical protein LOKO_01478 [Halomonas chromatireducens]